MDTTKKDRFKKVSIRLIDRPAVSSRMEIDKGEIQGLASSIKEQGLLQPIVLNEDGERYEIVAGDRRFLAVSLLGHPTILSKVVKMTREEIDLARGIENLQRHNLTPLEEGIIYINLMKVHKLTIDDISRRMGPSPGVVRRRMDILEMPESMQKAIHTRKVSLTVCEEIMACGDGAHREYLLEMAVEHGITKDVARMWVGDWKKGMRTQETASGEGPLHGSIMKPEIIYRPCDVCSGPVNIMDMQELRMCGSCFKNVTDALKGE